MKLQLTKQSQGYYSTPHGTMTITVRDQSVVIGGKSEWQIVITEGDEITFNECCATKSECYEIGVNFLMNDLA